MSTPDELAAALPEQPQTWDGRPVPEVGRAVKLKYSFTSVGRIEQDSACGIVKAVQQPQDRHLIITLGNDKSYLLVERTRDGWEYTDIGDVATVQAVVDAEETPAEREHHNRLATDPIYRHHWEVMAEGIALKQLQAERGDFDDNPFGPDVSDEITPTVGDNIPDPHADSLAARMRRLAWLDEEIEAHESEIKALMAERAALESGTIEMMAMEGVPSMTVDKFTWFMKNTHQLRRKDGVESGDVMKALRASSLGHMVTEGYSGSALKSLLLEYENSDGQTPVPTALADVVELVTITKLGRTRAAAKKRMPRAPHSPR